MKKIQPGDKVKDKISGISGIVTSISHYLYGCRRCGVVQSGTKSNEPLWFDEPQLDVVKSGVICADPVATGGPRPDPKRTNPNR